MEQTIEFVELKHPAPTTSKKGTGRNWYVQMDGLRFIAVIAVLIEHFAYFIGGKLHLGFFGVDLFFVISGFLISEGLFINKDKYSPSAVIGKFYLKRFLRIFPIYYLALIIAFLVYPPFHQIASWAFTYTINYYPAITGNHIIAPFGHLWSLSVEEQFYLFWPCIVLVTPRKYFFLVLNLIFFGSVIYFIIKQDYEGLPGRMYSLCFGAFLAYFKYKKSAYYNVDVVKRFLAILCVAVIVFFIQGSLGLSILSFGLVYLGSNNAFRGFLKRFLENKRVIYVGKISYGVYLYHLPIGYLCTYYFFNSFWTSIHFSSLPGILQKLEFHSWLVALPLYTAITILVAHISYMLIEKPILKYKDRIK